MNPADGREAGRRTLLFANVLLALSALACGCEAGPCVRTAPEAATWNPGAIVMLPVIVASGALSSPQNLPGDTVLASPQRAGEEVGAALEKALKAVSSAGILRPAPGMSATGVAASIEMINRQYLSMPSIDPALAASLGQDLETDAILLTAVLRYGPEAEGDPQMLQQNAQTKVGASQLSISSTASRTLMYMNCRFRCRLVRCSDAAVIWDASVSERQKKVAMLAVTQEGVLRKAVSDIAASFPYARRTDSRPAFP